MQCMPSFFKYIEIRPSSVTHLPLWKMDVMIKQHIFWYLRRRYFDYSFYQKRGPSYILPYFLRLWPTPCSLLTDTINNKINQSVINWVHEPNTVEVHWPNFFAWGSFAGKFRWIIVINDDMLHLANKRHFAKRGHFRKQKSRQHRHHFSRKKKVSCH